MNHSTHSPGVDGPGQGGLRTRPLLRTLATVLLAGHAGLSAPAQELDGRTLYEGAAACMACHQIDGKGLPQAVPPLTDNPWVQGDKQRLIRLVLHGLNGPILVSGERFDALMPPNAHLSNAELAAVLTYVRSSFGNQADAVTPAEVAGVRAAEADREQPWTTEALLAKFPFDKKAGRKNGVPKLDFKPDPVALRDITEIDVVRTWLPGATPAAIAVAYPGPQYLVWDAGMCRLRYVWRNNGFLHNLKEHWSSNGKPVARIEGTPYFSLPDHPPIAFGNESAGALKTEFLGYRLHERNPHLLYRVGSTDVEEWFTPTEDGAGLVWHLRMPNAPGPVFVRLGQQAMASFQAHNSRLRGGVWVFTPSRARHGVRLEIRPAGRGAL